MRADGTAANKAAATGPVSDAGACMSLAVHNDVGTTFSDDDIILISDRGGTYSGSGFTNLLICPSSGSAGHPIVYKNVAGENPVFENTRAIANSWTDLGGGIFKQGYGFLDCLIYSGVPLQKNNDATVASGQYYTDGTDIWVNVGGASPGANCKGSFGYWIGACICTTDRSNITITKNTTGSLTFQFSEVGIFSNQNATDVSGLTVDGCTFNYCADGVLFLAVTGDMTGGTVINNTGYRCQSMIRAYTAGITTFTIYNNTGTDIGTTDGSTWWSESSAVDRELIGLQNLQSCSIHNNISIGGRHQHIIMYCLAGQEIKDNIIYSNLSLNNDGAFLIISGDATWLLNNNKIYNNIYWNDSNYSYIVLYDKPTSAPTTDNYICNNIFIGNEVGLKMGGASSGAMGLVFKNNIIDAINAHVIWFNRADFTDMDFDYNLYGQDAYFLWGGDWNGFAAYRTASNMDTHSIQQEPVFVNAGGSYALATDFKLKSGSLCIGTGATAVLTTFVTDYEGKSLYNETGGVPIGAYRSWQTSTQTLPGN